MYSYENVKALKYLHEAGWVHRDINVQNLYLYTDPVSQEKCGLIGDLEYTKKVDWEGKQDVRTVCIHLYILTPSRTKLTIYLGNS